MTTNGRSKPATTRSRAARSTQCCREGNSDRRAPKAVKAYAKKHPHPMGGLVVGFEDFTSRTWSAVTSTRMKNPPPLAKDGNVRIELVAADGKTTVLKEKTPVLAGEVIDASVMSARELSAFLEREIEDAKKQGVLFSAPHESHDDEGLGPHNLRPRREGLFQGRLRQTRPLPSRRRVPTSTTVSAACWPPSRSFRRPNGLRSKRISRRPMRLVRIWPWWIRIAASRTYTYPATSSLMPPCLR